MYVSRLLIKDQIWLIIFLPSLFINVTFFAFLIIWKAYVEISFSKSDISSNILSLIYYSNITYINILSINWMYHIHYYKSNLFIATILTEFHCFLSRVFISDLAARRHATWTNDSHASVYRLLPHVQSPRNGGSTSRDGSFRSHGLRTHRAAPT